MNVILLQSVLPIYRFESLSCVFRTSLQELKVIRDATPNQYMVLVKFSTSVYLCPSLLSSSSPTACTCISLFMVQYSTFEHSFAGRRAQILLGLQRDAVQPARATPVPPRVRRPRRNAARFSGLFPLPSPCFIFFRKSHFFS